MSRAKNRLAPQTTRIRLSRLFLLLCLLPFVARAEDVKKIQPTGYVTDLAGALTAEAKTQLEALCTELEQKTGAQMAIVTVHSLEGDEAQVYANKLFKQLGIGSKKDDRGVMLLVAPDEHRYWTEVGYGLEPVINDARAGDAGRTMVPYFKRGDFSAGIQAGAWQLAKYIADDRNVSLSGQPQIQAPPVRRGTARGETGNIPFITLLIIGFIIFSIFVRIIGGLSNQTGRGGSSGSGCLWFLLGMLANSGGRSSGWGGGGGNWGGGGFGGGGGGFGGFGGGSSGGGGAGGSW